MGDYVRVLSLAGNPKRPKRKELLQMPGRYGEVVYVSRHGWATVRMDEGYTEAFWLDKLVELESGEAMA